MVHVFCDQAGIDQEIDADKETFQVLFIPLCTLVKDLAFGDERKAVAILIKSLSKEIELVIHPASFGFSWSVRYPGAWLSIDYGLDCEYPDYVAMQAVKILFDIPKNSSKIPY